MQAKIQRDVFFQFQRGHWLVFRFTVDYTLSRTQIRSHPKISIRKWHSSDAISTVYIPLPGVMAPALILAG